MKLTKRLTAIAIASILAVLGLGYVSVFAASDSVPMLPVHEPDWDSLGRRVDVYENGFIISSNEVTIAELKDAEMQQLPHIHPSVQRHVSLTPHSHSIANVSSPVSTSWVWRPTLMWQANSQFPTIGTWPSVTWSTHETTSVAAGLSASINAPTSVVTSQIGASFTRTHTVSTQTSRTFQVPYRRDGRVIVTFNRPRVTFTCVTQYYVRLPGPNMDMAPSHQVLVPSHAYGAPYNLVADLETRPN